MAGKKPKSGKPKSGKKGKKLAEPFVSKYPIIDYDKIKEVPEVLLNIRLDQGLSSYMSEIKIPITMTLSKIIERINERHGNSCHNIKTFIIENSSRMYMDLYKYKTFKEIGSQFGENLTLYYEYEPAIHPILEAGLV